MWQGTSLHLQQLWRNQFIPLPLQPFSSFWCMRRDSLLPGFSISHAPLLTQILSNAHYARLSPNWERAWDSLFGAHSLSAGERNLQEKLTSWLRKSRKRRALRLCVFLVLFTLCSRAGNLQVFVAEARSESSAYLVLIVWLQRRAFAHEQGNANSLQIHHFANKMESGSQRKQARFLLSLCN